MPALLRIKDDRMNVTDAHASMSNRKKINFHPYLLCFTLQKPYLFSRRIIVC